MESNTIKSISSGQKWLLLTIFFAGFLIRLVDLTDSPIDFHPTRQFRGATIARSIYIDSLPSGHPDYGSIGGGMVDQFEDLEPLILENMMAFLYRIFGGEEIWMVRIVNSIFWGIGGWALFNIVFQSIGFSSGIISLLYFLFLPFGVTASRSFQSDPLMTVGVVVSIYLAHKFFHKPSWKNTIILAIVAGITILIKVVAAYLVGGVMVALVLHRGFQKSLKDAKIWIMGIVMLLIPASYYVFSGDDAVAGNAATWIIQLLPLLMKSDFWIGWIRRLFAFGPVSSLIAGLGVLFILLNLKSEKRVGVELSGKLLLGALVGYFLYGLSFPHHIPTHSYYHIQLIPLVAWAIGFGIMVVATWIKPNQKVLIKTLWGIVVIWVIFNGSKSVRNFLENDYRHEPPYWQRIGEVVPNDGKTIGLTSYYGFLLRYYGGVVVKPWPDAADLALDEIRGQDLSDFEGNFESRTSDSQYFLITALNKLDQQTNLKDHLYSRYEVIDEGSGYILFSLGK